MKKTLKILIIPFIIILCVSIYIIYLISHNQKYLDSIANCIKRNYDINEEITYTNKYTNYYIFTTKDRVIVINNEFLEVLNESIAIIKPKPDNQDLIYKTNKLMFEETIVKNDELIYRYYDATTGNFIKETVLEQK